MTATCQGGVDLSHKTGLACIRDLLAKGKSGRCSHFFGTLELFSFQDRWNLVRGMDEKLGRILDKAENLSSDLDHKMTAGGLSNAKEGSVKSEACKSSGADSDGKDAESTPHNTKKRSWRKPKDKPKRPLSAYNLFFQQERERIIASIPDPQAPLGSSGSAYPPGRRDRRRHGKIGFADLARTIAERWRNLDDSSRRVFDAQASLEKERYRRELAIWRWKQDVAGFDETSQSAAAVAASAPAALPHMEQSFSLASFMMNASLQQAALLQQQYLSTIAGHQMPAWAVPYTPSAPAADTLRDQLPRRISTTGAAPVGDYPPTLLGVPRMARSLENISVAHQYSEEKQHSKPVVEHMAPRSPWRPRPPSPAHFPRSAALDEGSNASSSSSIISLDGFEGLEEIEPLEAFGDFDSLSEDSTPDEGSPAAVIDPEELYGMLRHLRNDRNS